MTRGSKGSKISKYGSQDLWTASNGISLCLFRYIRHIIRLHIKIWKKYKSKVWFHDLALKIYHKSGTKISFLWNFFGAIWYSNYIALCDSYLCTLKHIEFRIIDSTCFLNIRSGFFFSYLLQWIWFTYYGFFFRVTEKKC